ncbi:MAG: zinc metalloprotease HtpX [Thermoplasmata archaeon]|nr:zinc metalloprotease HtpX [Thermoplasmata archaeon]
MASLGALKRSMALTLILIFGLLFALLVVISTLVQWYMQDTFFPFWIQIVFIVMITILFVLIQWAISPGIIRWSSKLRYLKPGENPFFENTVKELCQKSGVPMPRLAVCPDKSPNAFVFGRSRSSATLAVHMGLLEQLNKDEIKGVLAHEIGHLKHNDMAVMTIVSVVPLLAYMLARSVLWSGGRRDKGGGALIAAAVIGLIVYVVSQLMILRLSRQREFYADTFSAVTTNDPHSLSSALAKITYGLSMTKEKPGAARSFYIGDPLSAKREISSIMQNKRKYDLDGDGVLDERELRLAMEEDAKRHRSTQIFSTHPSTFKRIQLLKEIEGDLKHGGMGKEIYKRI